MNTGSVTHATLCGPRRDQEDRFFHTPFTWREDVHGTFIAVMDGHGDSGASERCVRILQGRVLDILSEVPDMESFLRVLTALLAEETKEDRSGTTFSAACILPEEVTVAIVGDSPVVVINGNGEIFLSPSHNVGTNLAERAAAVERGGSYEDGYVWVGASGLQLGRSLGDARFAGVLSREPEIYAIRNPRLVLVGSDGLFDTGRLPGSPEFEEISELLLTPDRTIRNDAHAAALMSWASARRLYDNTTAVVWSAE